MNKPLKKLLICGASLMMVTSLGAGINNVSAHRVHRHTRTYRVTKGNHNSLYKLGYNDAKEFVKYYWLAKGLYPNTGTPKEAKQARKTTTQYIYHSIKYNFSKAYDKGFRKGYNDAGTTQMYTPLYYKNIRKLARKHHLNSKNAYNYFYGKHSYKRVTKHVRKNNKRHVAKKHSNKRIKKHVKRNKHLRKQTRKSIKKSVVKKATKKPTVNNSASNANNQNTSQNHYHASADQTDGGKYYSWDQLQNVLNSTDLLGGAESKATDEKIKDTLAYNLTKWNYSDKQLHHLENNPYINQYDPYMASSANAELSINTLP